MHSFSWNDDQSPEAAANAGAARALLAPSYAWFTKGFDTRDPKDAKTPLSEPGT